MVRGAFAVGIGLAAIATVLSCEDTDGLSGGGTSSPDAAGGVDATEDVVTSTPDVVSPPVDAGCDAAVPDPAFLFDAVEIDSSGYFVCAVRANGQVACWGDNTFGQLGVAAPDAGGTVVSSERPVVVPGIPPATHVATGFSHACAVVTGGEVWCWGGSAKGQTGAVGNNSPPVQVLGGSFTPLNNVVAISAGGAFTCALAQGGGALCWGDNDRGQLGTPGGFPLATESVPVPGLGVATAISAGFFHACAMTASGPKCWGGNQTGELGRSVGPEGGAPGEYPTGAMIARIVASSPNTCAIDVSGNAICSGYNLSGQLGNTNAGGGQIDTPFPIPELSSGNITDVDIGIAHTCGTRRDESAFCMSGMPMAALGRGPLDASSTDNAARTVDGLHPVASIKVGGRDYGTSNQHTCAIVRPACAQSGQVWCWGANGVGQLGDGTKTERARPVKVVASQ